MLTTRAAIRAIRSVFTQVFGVQEGVLGIYNALAAIFADAVGALAGVVADCPLGVAVGHGHGDHGREESKCEPHSGGSTSLWFALSCLGRLPGWMKVSAYGRRRQSCRLAEMPQAEIVFGGECKVGSGVLKRGMQATESAGGGECRKRRNQEGGISTLV